MATNEKKCEELMEQYLLLDKNQRVPLKLSMHILGCKKCRTQIKMLKSAEKIYSKPIRLETPLTDSTIEKVMLQISPETYKKYTKKTTPIRKWIAGALFIIAIMFIPSAFTTGAMHIESLSMAYALLIAVCITVYCCIFAIGNIDFFIKKISTNLR